MTIMNFTNSTINFIAIDTPLANSQKSAGCHCQFKDTLIQALDTDDNNQISLDEFTTPLAHLFSAADTNNNGELNSDEISKLIGLLHHPPKPPPENSMNQGLFSLPSVVDLLQQIDTNGDGAISQAELLEIMTKQFERTDSDQNGLLSLAELEEERLQFLAAHQPPPRNGRGSING